MKAYLYLIKTKWLVALAYRYELITNLFVQIILLVSSVFLWKAAYGGSDTVAGASLRQMADYAIVSLLLSLFYSTGVDNRLHGSIRKGNVALDFLKLVSVMGMHFAQDVADALFSMVFRLIPVFVVAALLFGAPIPVLLPAFGMFLACFWQARYFTMVSSAVPARARKGGERTAMIEARENAVV